VGVFLMPDFIDDLNVGPAEGKLGVDASVTAAAYGGAHPNSWRPTYTQVTDAPWVRQQSDGPSSARVVVKKVGKNKWSFEGTSTGDNVPNGPLSSIPYSAEVRLDAQLVIPETRAGTSQLKMDVTVQTLSGLCQLIARLGNDFKGAGGNNLVGGGVSESSPRLLTYSVSADDASRTAAFLFQIFASSGAQSASSCKATGTIELTVPEE